MLLGVQTGFRRIHVPHLSLGCLFVVIVGAMWQKQAKDEVAVLVSGGVDSSVALGLLKRAVRIA